MPYTISSNKYNAKKFETKKELDDYLYWLVAEYGEDSFFNFVLTNFLIISDGLDFNKERDTKFTVEYVANFWKEYQNYQNAYCDCE